MTAAVPAAARVLVADDHALVREGLKAVLNGEPDLEVVAEAADGRQAVALAQELHPDLAVLDVAMPQLTGLQAARELTRDGIPVLLLSMYDREQYVAEAVAAGAAGYVLKRDIDERIVSACRTVLHGGPFVCPPALQEVARRYQDALARGERPDVGLLTAREREVAKLIAEGHSSQQIATALSISLKTVDRHRTNILQKLGEGDRVAITRYAIRSGLVEP